MQRKTIFLSAHIRLWLQPTGSLCFMGAKKRPFSIKGIHFYNLPVSLSASASFLSTLSALAAARTEWHGNLLMFSANFLFSNTFLDNFPFSNLFNFPFFNNFLDFQGYFYSHFVLLYMEFWIT